jgi:inosine triphosphate pyrophosphatase
MTIYFVTGNPSKLREAQQILGDIESIKINLPELQGSPTEIVIEKAKLASAKTGKTVFVEDVSLCFSAFGGLPGPYIKNFIESMSLKDIVTMLDGFDDKSVTALCSIGYCEPGEEPICFEGEIKGTIVPPKGNSDFGWDPIFLPNGYDMTFAEMGPAEKNSISHRKNALEEFKKYLQK